jgi:outer membrane protein assembly factor BamE (lipoprotein component of BamABCDE complex)
MRHHCREQVTGKTMRSVSKSAPASFAAAALLAGALALGGCNTQVITHGAVISQNQLDLIPVGSSKDQVLLALGSPSTVGAFDNEVYYYISQTNQKKMAYQKPRLVDQRVLAVYFDEENIVAQVANYGIQDGKVFDFISRTTPTTGRDLTFLGQILAPSKGNTPPINPIVGGVGPGG